MRPQNSLTDSVESVDTSIDQRFPHGADDAESLLGHRLSGDLRSAKACRLCEACAAGDRAVRRALSRARTAAAAYEAGQKERIVISEFPSVEKATAAYASAAYQEALKALGDGAVRDIRIVEAL